MLPGKLLPVAAAALLFSSAACRQVTCTQDADCSVDGYTCQIPSGQAVGRCCRSDRPCNSDVPPKTCSLIAWQTGGTSESSRLGSSVALSGSQLLVGATGQNKGKGDALLYDFEKTPGVKRNLLVNESFSKALPSLTGAGNSLGLQVALSSNIAYATNTDGLYAVNLANPASSWSLVVSFPLSLTTNADGSLVAVADDTGSNSYKVSVLNGAKTLCQQLYGAAGVQDFGSGLSFNNKSLYIGAHRDTTTGSVYTADVSSCAGGTSFPPVSLSKPNSKLFGGSLAASNGRLLVGNAGDDGLTNPLFYEYNITAGAPTDEGLGLQADGLSSNSTSPISLAIAGDLLVIGTPKARIDNGVASIYQRQGGSWVQLVSTVSIPAAELPDVTLGGVGTSVAVAGGYVAIGAPTSTVSDKASSGAVLLYECL